MKKIISLTCFLLCLGFVSLAQNAQKTASLDEGKTKTCKPMSAEACASKMGISMAEYLALSKKNCSKTSTASLATKTSSSLPIVAVSNAQKTEKKCCKSMEACAKKMGMSVEECKAKCPDKTASASTLVLNEQK